MERYTLHHGDCLDVLRTMPDNSIDAVVTDPPYGLAFMGKRWDYDVPSVEVWGECLRVLKPGGHLLAFAGTRTQHRMAVRIEDAGFEIRDLIAWVYGSGFPKSLDVSKAIDKAAGAEREVVGTRKGQGNIPNDRGNWGLKPNEPVKITAPATDAARQWSGWGTALKPAMEPITVARKPLSGTVAENVLAHGTGAINVDGCRVGDEERWNPPVDAHKHAMMPYEGKDGPGTCVVGRWPANLIHDGSDEVVELFPNVNGSKPGSFQRVKTSKGLKGGGFGQERAAEREPTDLTKPGYDDSGSAARFFYCAKASTQDRDDGLSVEHEYEHSGPRGHKLNGERPPSAESGPRRNHHPTVKPTALMRYLCRLVTPPGGLVLDPFTGSGSTGKAAMLEGFRFVGIEREAEYVEIARRRISAAISGDTRSQTLWQP